jgi:prolyl oligopeptidase
MKAVCRALAPWLIALLPLQSAATFAGVAVPPPLPAAPVIDTHWGVEVTDPYRFLETTSDPKVQQWLRSQADATDAILAKIPGRAALLERIVEIERSAAGAVASIARTASGQLFFTRREPGENQFKLVLRDSPDAADRVLVDPEALAKVVGRPHAIMDFAPSPDGKLLAYSIQAGGGEIGTLHVIDVATGREVIPPIDRIRYASVAWLDDGRGFFYSRLRPGYEKLPATERFGDVTRHFHALGDNGTAGADRAVFSASRNPELKLPLHASGYVLQVPQTQVALAVVYLGVDRNRLVYVGDLDRVIAGEAQWRQVAAAGDQVSSVAVGGGWLYLRSAKNAPRYQLLRVPLADPDLTKAQTVVAPSAAVVVGVAAARDAVYVTRRDGATLSLARIAHDAKLAVEPVALPFEGNVTIEHADPRQDGVVLELAGWTRAAKPYLYELGAGVRQLALARPGAFDAPADIEAREVKFRSHDGVEVPMSILSRKGIALDGRNPTILYGYGAYGTTENPFFSPRIYAWLERGGVYAIAHVRGGGIYGDEWHRAGHKQTKHNTWRDGIAAAEWLIASGYTSRHRLGIYGGSAGGIFVGRAITERPDLFAAAVPAVAVLDLVRSETRANGVANVPEYGTVTKEDEFHALLAASSYHHVQRNVDHPGVMLVHGVNDIRVDVWQSAKFASALAATRPSRPVLMRLEYESGHGQGSTRTQAQQRTTDVWAFMLWQFGVPDFQPSR